MELVGGEKLERSNQRETKVISAPPFARADLLPLMIMMMYANYMDFMPHQKSPITPSSPTLHYVRLRSVTLHYRLLLRLINQRGIFARREEGAERAGIEIFIFIDFSLEEENYGVAWKGNKVGLTLASGRKKETLASWKQKSPEFHLLHHASLHSHF